MYFLAQNFNSHAVGMADAQPYAFKVDFVRNPISEPAAQFFVYILIFIFSHIYEIKISEKKFLNPKIISFSKADFQKSSYASIYTSFDLYLTPTALELNRLISMLKWPSELTVVKNFNKKNLK